MENLWVCNSDLAQNVHIDVENQPYIYYIIYPGSPGLFFVQPFIKAILRRDRLYFGSSEVVPAGHGKGSSDAIQRHTENIKMSVGDNVFSDIQCFDTWKYNQTSQQKYTYHISIDDATPDVAMLRTMAATRLVLILLGFLVAFFVTSTNCKTQPNWGLKLFRHSQDWCTTVASCMPWVWPLDVLAILMLPNRLP